MGKYFIFSARTAVSKREVTQCFGSDNTIVIPMAVVDEIQTVYAQKYDERGKIARALLDYLWSFDRKMLFGKGVIQENGSTLMVTNDYHNEELSNEKVTKTQLTPLQVQVLKACLSIKKKYADPKGEKVILVSKDTALRMKAEFLGVQAQTFRDELLPEICDQYTGRADLKADVATINSFYKDGSIAIDEVKELNPTVEFYPNMFITMKCGRQASAIGRVEGERIVTLVHEKANPYGVIPKNVGQRFMIEALMMDVEKAPLVIFKGPAGTAKTFMALAAGLEQSVNQEKFANRILISRSPTETGEKMGFLPGDENEKLGPYMRGIMDNLKKLHSGSKSDFEEPRKVIRRGGNNYYAEKPESEDGRSLFEQGMIKAEAIGFIRGRSISDTYIIIDEAQNLTATEIKTIITRVGEGTKLVIIGDPAQIDRPELSERDNGLSYASERMKGDHTCWQITMTEEETVRSELAKRASVLL